MAKRTERYEVRGRHDPVCEYMVLITSNDLALAIGYQNELAASLPGWAVWLYDTENMAVVNTPVTDTP